MVGKLGQSERQSVLLSEAVTTARAISRPYDRAHALVMLAPTLTSSVKDQVVQEALDTVRAIDGFRERAEILTALAPMLDVIQRNEAIHEALTAIHEGDWTQNAVTGTVSEDLVVETDRFARFLGGQSAALLDVALSVDEPERTALISQAFDAIYDLSSYGQAYAIISLAPHLSEEQAQKALADIGSMKTDPWREQIVSMLLLCLAEMASPEVALKSALEIYGQSVPEALTAALTAETPKQATDQSQEVSFSRTDKGTEQQSASPARPADNRFSPSIDDDLAEIANNDDEAGDRISFTIMVHGFGTLYGLGDFLEISLVPDNLEDRPEQRQQILDNIFASYLEQESQNLSQDDVRRGLASAQEFQFGFGAAWRQAATALLVRLAGLGFVGEALAEARSAWGQPMPAEAAVSLASAVPEADKDGLLREALASVRGRETASI